ncbi:MAG: hypothetical protein K1X35_13290 [Caulobacteraceae bacterium]|nr:hypothetical protein [Caulobacteraceae bacterium]
MKPVPIQRGSLLPLFLISLGVVGIENALTRYFAVSAWSEYGYWIISIVMAGFALSGVFVALFRETVERAGIWLRALLPAAMVLAAAWGFREVTANPFNPLQLQNPVTWVGEVRNIGLYYAALLPFFFLAGTYISLIFVQNDREVGRVYAFDLIGAALGSAAALVLMFLAHPFLLTPILLLPLAVAPFFQNGRHRWLGGLLGLAALVGGEYLLFTGPAPAFSEFKAIYAPMNTPGARVMGQLRSPRGYYVLLDDFTERVDADVSNNAQMLGVPGPPQTFGLYRDGARIAGLPRPRAAPADYAPSALSSAPYLLRPHPEVLQVGLSGGYRAAEALALGARRVDGVESEPILRQALQRGFGGAPPLRGDPRFTLLRGGPIAAALAARGRYDLIDLSSDFVDVTPANQTGLTVEAFDAYLDALRPGGIVSVSVSIRDFPVYALRVLATAREALRARGLQPARHVMVYRSAWNARVLVSSRPFTPAVQAALSAWASERSFDISYAPGLDARSARARLFNDLPSVDFSTGQVTSRGPDDALANEVPAVLAGHATPTGRDFHVRPATLDRPAYYASLRLENLGALLKRLEVLPQAEIGGLVNLAVLAQAIVIALLVLAAPALFRRRVAGREEPRHRWSALYFPALGLGFLFIEIMLIDKAAFYLNDYSTAFALVLTSMLLFSGIGSLIAGQVSARPKAAAGLSLVAVLAWCALVYTQAEPWMVATLGQPYWLRAVTVMAVAAPVALALGIPFPMGLTQVGAGRALPWAWGLNGAFSVVATPLANLISRDFGFSWLLISAAALYAVAFLALPPGRRRAAAPAEPAASIHHAPETPTFPGAAPEPVPSMEAAR